MSLNVITIFHRKEAVVCGFLGIDFLNFYAKRLNKIWEYTFDIFLCRQDLAALIYFLVRGPSASHAQTKLYIRGRRLSLQVRCAPHNAAQLRTILATNFL
jgi:hypothetical protein